MMKRVCALAVALYPVLFAQAAILPGNHASRAEKYLFYLHGKILEDQGIPRPRSERYGYYEYEKIVETFHSRGFTVRSEIRPPNTQVLAYAEKIAGEIRGLLRSGVAPGRITVVGASKGGVIAIFISALLQERDIHFVFLASCHEAVYRNLQEMGMRIAGNILSIYDAADDTGCGSCRNFIAAAREKRLGRYKEIVLHMALGHGFLYRPYAEWVEPVVAWANDEGAAAGMQPGK